MQAIDQLGQHKLDQKPLSPIHSQEGKLQRCALVRACLPCAGYMALPSLKQRAQTQARSFVEPLVTALQAVMTSRMPWPWKRHGKVPQDPLVPSLPISCSIFANLACSVRYAHSCKWVCCEACYSRPSCFWLGKCAFTRIGTACTLVHGYGFASVEATLSAVEHPVGSEIYCMHLDTLFCTCSYTRGPPELLVC